MRSKLRLLAAALCCVTILTACQGKNDQSPFSKDLVQKLADGSVFSEELEELPADTAFALYRLSDYGLSQDALTDCALLRSSGATCEEAAVLILDSSQSAEKAEQALTDYLENQITSNQDYRPTEIPKLENAILERRSDTVLLVVANDREAADSIISG